MPTPVLSPPVMFAGSLDEMMGDWAGGDMGAGGGAIMSLARREVVEAMRRGLRGEGGRELRSGAMSPEMLRCVDVWMFLSSRAQFQGP